MCWQELDVAGVVDLLGQLIAHLQRHHPLRLCNQQSGLRPRGQGHHIGEALRQRGPELEEGRRGMAGPDAGGIARRRRRWIGNRCRREEVVV